MSNIERYMQGWTTGDLDMIQGACAEDCVFDDPYDGRITKAQFPEYWETHPGDIEGGFSDSVVQEADGIETAWAWWHWAPKGGTEEETQMGSVLMKADADGLHSVRLAYYRR
jgi:hypothetical protein